MTAILIEAGWEFATTLVGKCGFVEINITWE